MPGIGGGSMLLVTRGEIEYSPKFTSSVGIFHCEGARSREEEALLAKAFAGGDQRSVHRLRRDKHELGPKCWLHTSAFCLESDPALRRAAAIRTPSRRDIGQLRRSLPDCANCTPDCHPAG
jgi:hypothetical protein